MRSSGSCEWERGDKRSVAETMRQARKKPRTLLSWYVDLNQGGGTEVFLTGEAPHGVEDIARLNGRKMLKYNILYADSTIRGTHSRFLLYSL